MIPCFTCGQKFGDYDEVALHIMSQPKKTHKKGRRWAAKRLAGIKDKREHKEVQPIPDELKQRAAQIVRETSGETERVITICPCCKQRTYQEIEIEYITDNYAWHSSWGTLVIRCRICRSKKKGDE